MTETDLQHELAWLEEVSVEVEPVALAAAAIKLLNGTRGMDLAPPQPEPKRERGRRERREDDGSRAQRSNRAPRDEAEVTRVNEVELFIGLGKTAGVRPGDIVGALANEFEVSGKDIGRVMLFDRNAFVGLPKSIADRLLDKHDKITIRGKTTYLSLARGRSGGGGGGGGDKPYKRRTHKGRPVKGPKKDHKRRKKWNK